MADKSVEQIEGESQSQPQLQPSDTQHSPASDVATTAASAATPSTNVSGKRKPPTKKSNVWEHFRKLPLDETGGEHRAVCKYCEASYACHPTKHGTNSLNRHLKACLKNPHRTKNQPILAYNQPSSGDNVGGIARTLVPHTYSLDECRKVLAKFVIRDEMSFRVVEGNGFRELLNQLEPRSPIPSRVTVARDCLKLYKEEGKKLKYLLKKSCARVCLTTDTWSSSQNFNYMCLTAHFIDEEWRLQKRILNFCIVENHKGDTIGKAIEKCLLEWGIEKVFTLTVDNASSNDTAVAYLKKRLKNWNGLVCDGDYLHVRCCAHILNLVVNDGLKDLHNSISAIRNAIRYVRSSPARLQKFKSFVEKEKIESKGLLCLDITTRWNSTYIMLEHAMKFQKVFERMEDEDETYNAYFKEDDNRIGPPMAYDWSNASVFIDFLKVFYNITLKFSGSLYVTSNTCFHEIAHIQTMLQVSTASTDTLVGDIANNMQKKYDKYWGKPENMNPLLVIGVVLDPRYKLAYVNTAFDDIYLDHDICVTMKRKIKDTLYRLYEQYSVGIVNESSEKNDDRYGSDGRDLVERIPTYIDPKNKWLASKKLKFTCDPKSELDKYLTSDLVEEEGSFDILAWWKDNAGKYKVLSLIARDVLAVPVSTVASESVFSTGGRVLDVFRSSLSPKMAEALICTQNWLSPHVFNFNDHDFDQYEEFENMIESELSDGTSVTKD